MFLLLNRDLTAERQISCHIDRAGQLFLPHLFMRRPPGCSLPVLSAHSVAIK